MGEVNQTIVVNIQALVDGNAKVRELRDLTIGLETTTGKTATSMDRMTGAGGKLDGMFGRLKTSSSGFAFAISGLGKSVEGEFAPLSAAGAKIDDFVRKERTAIAELERVKSQRAAVASRDQVFASGSDPFSKGAAQFGETTLSQVPAQLASFRSFDSAEKNTAAMEKERSALIKLNDESIRSGHEGSENVQRLSTRFNQIDEPSKFSNLIQGLRTVESSTARSALVAGVLNTAYAPIAAVGNAIKGVFSQVAEQIQTVAAAAVTFVTSLPSVAFGFVIKAGLQFDNVIEQQRIGLAALIQSTEILFSKDRPNTPLEGIDAYRAATAIADESTKRLFTKLIPLRATSQELLPVFNQIVSGAAAANLTLVQTEDTFVSLAAAAQILQVPIERLGTDIRLLITGAVRATSRLGTGIFGSAKEANEFIKLHKESGDLFDALQKKLIAYRLALLDSTQSFSVLGQNTLEVFQRLSGLATASLFERIKQGLINITRAFFDLDTGKVQPRFQALFDFIQGKLGEVGAFLTNLTNKVISYLGDIAGYVQKNQGYINTILTDVTGIGQQLGGIVVDMGTIVGDVDATRSKTASWHTILQFVRGVLAGIRDEMNFIVGLFEFIVGGLVGGLLHGLDAALTLVQNMGGVLGTIATALRLLISDARKAADEAGERGGDRIRAGLRNTRDEVEQQRLEDFDTRGRFNPVVGPSKRFIPADQRKNNPTANDFNSQLKLHSDPDDKKKREALENRLGELNKQTAELLRQLYDSQNEIEREKLLEEFTLIKDATDRTQKELDRSYKDRLVSIRDYYDEKNKLEQIQINLEQQNLKDSFERDRKDAQSKVDSITDKFLGIANDQGERSGGLLGEPKNKNPEIQAQLLKQRHIEIQKVLNDLEVKRLKLETDLGVLEGKKDQTAVDNLNAQKDALEELRGTNERVQTDLLESQGRASDAEIRRVAEQYRDTLQQTLVNTNPASAGLTDVIESIKSLGSVTTTELNGILEEAGIKFSDLSEETQALIKLMKQLEAQSKFKGGETAFSLGSNTLQLQRDAIQDKINLGVITEAKGRHEIALAEQQMRIELDKVLDRMAALPGLTDQERLAIAQMRAQTKQLGREFDTIGNEINSTLSNDLGNFFGTLLEGSQSFGDAFRSALSGILLDIGKVIFQAIVLKGIISTLGLDKIGIGGTGSAGGIGGVLSGFLGSLFHSSTNGLSGIGAIGGFAEGGLADGPGNGTSDSILARVSKGEWIIPAARVTQYGHSLFHSLTKGTFGNLRFANGGPVGSVGGSASPGKALSFRNINVLDPELITDHLKSSRGEAALINFISRNPTQVRRALGL